MAPQAQRLGSAPLLGHGKGILPAEQGASSPVEPRLPAPMVKVAAPPPSKSPHPVSATLVGGGGAPQVYEDDGRGPSVTPWFPSTNLDTTIPSWPFANLEAPIRTIGEMEENPQEASLWPETRAPPRPRTPKRAGSASRKAASMQVPGPAKDLRHYAEPPLHAEPFPMPGPDQDSKKSVARQASAPPRFHSQV